MNEFNAKVAGLSRRSYFYSVPGDADLACVWVVYTAENFHQRRFSGAVFSDKRDDFGRIHFQIDVVERDHAREPFADPLHFQNWRRIEIERHAVSFSGYRRLVGQLPESFTP